MNESDAVVAAITAWAVVRLTGLALQHRRATAKAGRDAAAKSRTGSPS